MSVRRPRSAAIVGAGAIGAWLADAMDRAGWSVFLVARGATLEALRRRGLRVERSGESRVSHPSAGTAAECGVCDYVFLTVKAQMLPVLVPELEPLLGPGTSVISATNGIPWWFFSGFSGPLEGAVLHTVDPGGVQARAFPVGRTLGGVVHASARVRSPGEVEVVAADRFLVGDPSGGDSAQAGEVAEALCTGGINALVSPRIRDEVWAKLWGNMNMNPLSALCRSGTAALLADPDVRALCIRMMEEMRDCGRLLGLNSSMSPGERIAVTERLGDIRTSMLMDAEAGRPLEIEPQLGAIVEIAGLLGQDAPFCRSVLGLVRLLGARGS